MSSPHRAEAEPVDPRPEGNGSQFLKGGFSRQRNPRLQFYLAAEGRMRRIAQSFSPAFEQMMRPSGQVALLKTLTSIPTRRELPRIRGE